MDFDEMMNKWLDTDNRWADFERIDHSRVTNSRDHRSFLKRLSPEAEIDLHGRTTEESEYLLSEFLKSAVKKGLRKVLIIHGKGIHSSGVPVLAAWVRQYLEVSPVCGETGHPDKRDGGSGATWVILK
ncbi:MAG: Smr/MutS family protein [Spirochaetales bacterium]|nr:Smr/MutS family protein [Spirochaetales bacterium]